VTGTASTAQDATAVATGVFAGPTAGLRYRTPTTTGVTNERGEFRYRAGEAVTFSVGGLVLGAVEGAPLVNLAQLVPRVDGRIDKLHDPIVTNLARLVQTLDQDGNIETGVSIAPVVHEVVEPMVIDFGQAAGGPAHLDGRPADADRFADDPLVTGLLAKLDATPGAFTANTPRKLRGGAAARNALRRDIRGIVKEPLKGVDNGVMDEAPVRVQVRTGNGASYLCEENEWPIARTEYRRWYLDARPSDWAGDGLRSDFLRIGEDIPSVESGADHSAHLDLGRPTGSPAGPIGGTPRWSTGISFVSDPLPEDMALVGYMKAGLWVSSTSNDMDAFVSLRVLDEQDREIRYESVVHPIDPHHVHPVGHGWLKVSHRALDRTRSTEYWPVHTHTEADHQPLESGEVVPIEVGLNPSSALIRKGCRLRIDVQPHSPAGLPVRAYDETYHVGATNRIHTGPQHPSYVQLPIVPRN
jgi:hypothetical protein